MLWGLTKERGFPQHPWPPLPLREHRQPHADVLGEGCQWGVHPTHPSSSYFTEELSAVLGSNALPPDHKDVGW